MADFEAVLPSTLGFGQKGGAQETQEAGSFHGSHGGVRLALKSLHRPRESCSAGTCGGRH
jgi:hypothetical protein